MVVNALNMKGRNGRWKRDGFTLVEILIALAILGLLLTTVYKVFITQESMFRAQEQITKTQQNLRATTEFLNQEMAWMGYDSTATPVLFASPTQIIFSANIPNLGTDVRYVNYSFNGANNTIQRAVGTTLAYVTNPANLSVLASDVDSLTFTFFTGSYSAMGFTAGTTLTSSLLGANPGDDGLLNEIRHIRANITVRSREVDGSYTHPQFGDNFRRRSAVVEIKLRNVEDLTVSAGGGLGSGVCSDITMNITYSGTAGQYEACTDFIDDGLGNPLDLTDNPIVTVNVNSASGSYDNTTPVILIANNAYDFMDSDSVSSSVINDRTNGSGSRYVVARNSSVVSEDTIVEIEALFTPPEPGCIQRTQTQALTIVSSAAARFDTTFPFTAGLIAEHVDLDTSLALDPQPTELPVCSTQARQGVRLTVRLEDLCGNGIEGETVDFSATSGSFQGPTTDLGDGTYEIVYLPPDMIGSVVPAATADITATWQSETSSTTVLLKPASAYDIVVESIDKASPPEFQFVSNVAVDNGSTFSIERVDDQWVTVDYYITDACGNRVFYEQPNITIIPDSGLYTGPGEDPGTALHSFDWKSNLGCGRDITNQTLEIRDDTVTETITYNLLETQTGPMVLVSPSKLNIQAGDTNDFTVLTVEIKEYDPEPALCVNVPGPFDVNLEVENDVPADGNGSFSSAPLYDTVTTSTTADGAGVATVNLYSGTADKGNTITVTAVADVDGAAFTGNTSVNLSASNPNNLTGYFTSSSYVDQMGPLYTAKAYSTDATIYVQVQDYDQNESPIAVDSMVSPYVSVTIVSDRTGDSEKVDLLESGSNTTLFRGNINSEVNSTASPDDGTLQVLRGDTLTMTYIDKDDPDPATEWTYEVYTAGPRSLELYLVDGVGAETALFSGSTQLSDVDYGDKVRPKLYMPEYDSDGSFAMDTVTILFSSGGGEDDVVTLREDADTGVFIPDSLAYGGNDFVRMMAADPGNDADILFIPYTPNTVTVTYPDIGPVIEQLTFAMSDHDLPTVSLDTPSNGDSVSGTVTVTISAEDTNNFTTTAGIARIDLYINGYLYRTLTSPPDLAGANTIDWVTAQGGFPYWLDGQHTIYAKATDVAGNPRTTAPITVTVDNNLGHSIEWTSPPFLDIQSQTVPVGVLVSNLDTSVMTYNVSLSIAGSAYPMTDLGGGAWGYSWDSTSQPDGTVGFIAQVRDDQNNVDEITLDVIVDNTPPTVGFGTVPVWINAASFPIMADIIVTDTNGVDPASVTGEFTGACSSSPAMAMSPVGADTYRIIWAGPCSGVDGSVTLQVNADDLADPPNTASEMVTTSIDTIYPTLDPISASPTRGSSFTLGPYTIDSFVAGTVNVSSRVVDNHPDTGWIAFQFFQDPWYGWPASWTDPVVFGPMDASGTGDFFYTWDTNGEYLPAQPWEAGIYVVAVDGTDMAANAASPKTQVYYLDNYEPWGGMNIMSWPVWGSKYVTIEADANFGFVKSIENIVVTSGGTPGIDDVATATISVPISAKARWYQDSWLWDTTTLSDGTYDVYASAEDWAGNTSIPSSWPINVFNKYADNMAAVLNTLGGSKYRMNLTGNILHPVDSTDGIPLLYEVNHYTAAGTLLASVQYPGTTGPGGAFDFAVSTGSFQFDAGDLFTVRFTSDPEGYRYGELEGKILGVQTWHGPMQFANLTWTFNSLGAGEYDRLTLDGELIYANGDPAVSESIRIDFNFSDRDLNWWFTNYIVSTDGLGQFTLQIDAPVPLLGPWLFADGDEMMFWIADWNWNLLTELRGFVPTLNRRD